MAESILVCPLFLDDFKRPVMPPCQHAFCYSCISRYIQKAEAKCPICRRTFDEEDLRRCLQIEQMLLGKSSGLGTKEEGMNDGSAILTPALAALPRSRTIGILRFGLK
ncbi:Helicase-like transcription factor [Taenia solium]|eukprot:TsM_000973100 transcript=TsM_000973100 gene=TsM_000973100